MNAEFLSVCQALVTAERLPYLIEMRLLMLLAPFQVTRQAFLLDH